MLKNLKLGTKFNLLLALAFISGVVLSGVTLSKVIEQRSQAEVADQAELLMQTINSVRDYTNDQIQPLLAAKVETDDTFTPEIIPSFSAREVFQNLRSKKEYSDFFYKEATLNPTNLTDKADSFETTLVQRFRDESNTKEILGFRDLPIGKVFYIARPLAINKESCLRCHSTPDLAPKSQLATYGREYGFGWKLNEVIAAQIVSVPATEILKNSQHLLSMLMGIIIGIFAIIILIINFLLKRAVIQPIRQMSKTAEAISLGKVDAEFRQESNDEIGTLATAFKRMKASFEISMRLLDKSN